MMEYEALGRYTAHREEAERWARERNRLLSDLKLMIQTASAFEDGRGYAYEFNEDKAQDLLTKAVEAQHALRVAIAAANEAASSCGKPAIKTVTY